MLLGASALVGDQHAGADWENLKELFNFFVGNTDAALAALGTDFVIFLVRAAVNTVALVLRCTLKTKPVRTETVLWVTEWEGSVLRVWNAISDHELAFWGRVVDTKTNLVAFDKVTVDQKVHSELVLTNTNAKLTIWNTKLLANTDVV